MSLQSINSLRPITFRGASSFRRYAFTALGTMKKIVLAFSLLVVASIANSSDLDSFKSQQASILDLGLLALERHFSEPININFSLYREGFISSQDGAQYLSMVHIAYGDLSVEKEKIVIHITAPYFNSEFMDKMKGVSRNGAVRLATAYFNAVREKLGVRFKEDGSVEDDITSMYLGKWFSPRGSSLNALQENAAKIGRNISLRTTLLDVGRVGFLSCEANGLLGKTNCKAFGE